MQAPLGFLVDKVKAPVKSALLGCVLVVLSILFYKFTLLSVFLAGIGNALYHLGGGIISLNLKPGKAFLPGVFVAPGAFGLFIGVTIVKKNCFMAAPFIFLLSIIFVLILFLNPPQIDYNTRSKGQKKYLELIIILLLVSISIRSLVGDLLSYPWKSNIYLLVIFTMAVVLGKALGGILGDKFGWTKIAVAGLLISIPLLFFGSYIPLMGIAGIFAFNMTMPVTLTAISNLLPGRAGLAFGLTPLALFLGLKLKNTKLDLLFHYKFSIPLIILSSAVVLFIALKCYFNGEKQA